jgi:hypothetical protein
MCVYVCVRSVKVHVLSSCACCQCVLSICVTDVRPKRPWRTLEAVDDDAGGYIKEIEREITRLIPKSACVADALAGPLVSLASFSVRDAFVHDKYFTNFCHKVVSAVGPKLVQSLLRCKPLGTFGAEQLQLDVLVLQTTLDKMPIVQAPLKSGSSAYSRAVKRGDVPGLPAPVCPISHLVVPAHRVPETAHDPQDGHGPASPDVLGSFSLCTRRPEAPAQYAVQQCRSSRRVGAHVSRACRRLGLAAVHQSFGDEGSFMSLISAHGRTSHPRFVDSSGSKAK